MSPEKVEMLKKKSKCEGNNNAFPQFKGLLKYVNYRDYQLFAKRFRKYLFTKIGSYEKISSYVVSEYTPKTFRPHFHILFFFDSDEIAENIRQAVYQSWRLGRVETHRIKVRQILAHLACGNLQQKICTGVGARHMEVAGVDDNQIALV